LVFDDPVQAFDDLRIDLLSTELARLGQTRRVVVFTHDARLPDYLRAKIHEVSVITFARDPLTGEVRTTDESQPWKRLLEDAKAVLHSQDPAVQELGAPEILIRGLCRHALDNALRQYAINSSLATSKDVTDVLKKLNKEQTTEDRLNFLRREFATAAPRMNPVDEARGKCASYLPLWNRAVHGNPVTEPATEQEINAAWNACKILIRTR
jgi:hypothetical protein